MLLYPGFQILATRGFYTGLVVPQLQLYCMRAIFSSKREQSIVTEVKMSMMHSTVVSVDI